MNIGKGITISVRNRLYLNLCNLVFFLIVTFTGYAIQIQYHMHGLPETYSVMGFDKTEWALLHRSSAVVCFAGLVVHCLVNWGFVATSTRRIFDGKPNTPFFSQSYLLLLISVPACLTAMASWILFGGNERARFVLVETHDKLGWFLVIFGLIHLISRSWRMISIFRTARERTKIDKNRTEYICFDSGKCQACWKCIEVCPNDVIGKINIVIHRHMKIVSRDNCIGCLKCIKACSHRAISPIVVERLGVPSVILCTQRVCVKRPISFKSAFAMFGKGLAGRCLERPGGTLLVILLIVSIEKYQAALYAIPSIPSLFQLDKNQLARNDCC